MSKSRALVWSVLLVLAAALPEWGRVQTGFLDRAVTVSGTSYRYQVFVPSDFSTKKSWPVVLFLHGSGERGDDGLIQTDVGIGHAIRVKNSRFPFVVVMPQCRNERLWGTPEMEAQALAALDASIKEFHGDRNHVYLTGLSMGGYGTWEIAIRHPGRFAALVPICSGLRPLKEMPELFVSVAGDPKIADPFAEVARRVANTPIWMFHGGDDDTVPVTEARQMAEALTAVKAKFKYTEYPGVGHNAWDNAYAEPDLIPWMLEQSLKH
ncbi:MAG: prolyl oligopeptidase family serine peptidase [Acidobacteria bacterium]|nr:prolyl oligopeptidase family serine peptidase [Acidobacteriota bacterium]